MSQRRTTPELLREEIIEFDPEKAALSIRVMMNWLDVAQALVEAAAAAGQGERRDQLISRHLSRFDIADDVLAIAGMLVAFLKADLLRTQNYKNFGVRREAIRRRRAAGEVLRHFCRDQNLPSILRDILYILISLRPVQRQLLIVISSLVVISSLLDREPTSILGNLDSKSKGTIRP